MGIEPMSEAWEACCRQPKTHKLAAFCRFSDFSNGFQLEQRRRVPVTLAPGSSGLFKCLAYCGKFTRRRRA